MNNTAKGSGLAHILISIVAMIAAYLAVHTLYAPSIPTSSTHPAAIAAQMPKIPQIGINRQHNLCGDATFLAPTSGMM